MSTAERTQALLDIVDVDRRERVAILLRDARTETAALLRTAHRAARGRIADAFAEERRLRDERVHAAWSNLQTRKRLLAQERARAELAHARQILPEALLARWRDAHARAQWAARVVARARTTLPRASWMIEHPADWPVAERDALVRSLKDDTDIVATCRVDGAIRAGVRIGGTATVVDGTLDALLDDRRAIDARLLARLETNAAEATP